MEVKIYLRSMWSFLSSTILDLVLFLFNFTGNHWRIHITPPPSTPDFAKTQFFLFAHKLNHNSLIDGWVLQSSQSSHHLTVNHWWTVWFFLTCRLYLWWNTDTWRSWEQLMVSIAVVLSCFIQWCTHSFKALKHNDSSVKYAHCFDWKL